ncbi:MAG: multicopper oxidase family protein, partial [Gemmatimonadota bacterium]
ADWLPPANREVALVLDDLLLADDGPVPWGDEAATHALSGRFGNVFTVNGEPDWSMIAERNEVVRLWITNVASTRTFNVSLPGATMKLLGTDVGLYEREEFVENLVIAPAERLIVDVRFDAPGAVPLVNAVKAVDHVYGGIVAEVDTLGAVTVGDNATAPDHTKEFVTLRANADVTAEVDPHRARLADPPDVELVLTLEVGDLPFPIGPMMRLESIYAHPIEWSGTMPGMNQASTARQVRWILKEPGTGDENEAIAWRFDQGDLVKLRLTSDRTALHAMHHPIHIHGQRMLVLSTNGRPTANMAWKDTVVVPAGGVVDVLVEMSNPGGWMLHCHIAEHLETGMRTVFRVDAGAP